MKKNIELTQHHEQNTFTEQLLQSVSDAYLNPTERTADSEGHMNLNILAEEFSMTWMKMKLLYTLPNSKIAKEGIFLWAELMLNSKCIQG